MSVNPAIEVRKYCDAAAVVIQMYTCTKYENCSCLNFQDTELNIELNAIVNIGLPDHRHLQGP